VIQSSLKRITPYLINPALLETTLQWFRPTASLIEVRAEVVKTHRETPDTLSIWLKPNGQFKGMKAGQFARVNVDVNGRRLGRTYSLSTVEGTPLLRFTIKAIAGGVVSNSIHNSLRQGDVVTLDQFGGEFTLARAQTPTLQFVAAGSGVTPVMSMLYTLEKTQPNTPVQFFYISRNRENRIFADELDALAARWPALTLMNHDSDTQGVPTATDIARALPGFGQHSTWVCGPRVLIGDLQALFVHQPDLLVTETFMPPVFVQNGESMGPVQVTLEAQGKTFTTQGETPLLQQIEATGLQPKNGCRMGICASCTCVKVHGAHQNLLTGEISNAPNEVIKLCTSRALSDVTLNIAL